MAAVHLSDALGGGDLFVGFISAVAFATILAVVAGLTLSGASAISHDLYANVFKKVMNHASFRASHVKNRDAWFSNLCHDFRYFCLKSKT